MRIPFPPFCECSPRVCDCECICSGSPISHRRIYRSPFPERRQFRQRLTNRKKLTELTSTANLLNPSPLHNKRTQEADADVVDACFRIRTEGQALACGVRFMSNVNTFGLRGALPPSWSLSPARRAPYHTNWHIMSEMMFYSSILPGSDICHGRAVKLPSDGMKQTLRKWN